MSGNRDITVIITCFNYGRFVREAVASARAQRGGTPRVVVVDDGSTDPETIAVIDDMATDVDLVRTPNGGPAAARNVGATRTDTPFVLMLDGDDRLAPGALSALRTPLEADSGLGFSYGLVELFGDASGPLTFPAYDPFKLLYRSLVTATSLIRRETFEAVGGFDTEISGYEDWDFYLGALEHGWTGRRVDETMLHYRRHGHSTLSGHRHRYRHSYRALRRKHAPLYSRAGEFARASDLGLAGRLAYRTFWAWRPVPARVEQALYARLFR